MAVTRRDLALVQETVGRTDAARESLQQARAVLERKPKSWRLEALLRERLRDALCEEARLAPVAGKFDPAEKLFERACKLFPPGKNGSCVLSACGRRRMSIVSCISNVLASFYQAQGNSAQAEPLYRQALEIRKQALGEKHPDCAISLNNLASLYQDRAN